ncbi:50S ribosomal protein L4 [Christensenellaceae bacterium NSJ-44]|uniref:Large ribosomal subunit protein uL4 n=1 Tax=Luoshenia tenuis TaxID=2763654 RepID=A0A926D3T8_9FIRM|nr:MULTISPECIES: 50S ribosomal protein L4 [Clostridia]MBC8529845.1 50S ribosomal protein L4 [Luoshenia tenuis]SCJ64639.1 50S ribosomal protein L4 [uncultured Clostridium sp.]
MPKIALLNMQGASAGEMELSEAVFGQAMNEPVVHQVIVAQLANKRQGTQSTLTRSEVAGGGIKPWRQKGTGRARQGSTRSPQWRHGGVVFAPKPRDYTLSVNKKVRRLAMKCALSNKVSEGSLLALDALELPQAKTREMAKVLENIKAAKKVVLVLSDKNETIERAARNIPGVKLLFVNTLNVLDLMNADQLVADKATLTKIEEVYA